MSSTDNPSHTSGVKSPVTPAGSIRLSGKEQYYKSKLDKAENKILELIDQNDKLTYQVEQDAEQIERLNSRTPEPSTPPDSSAIKQANAERVLELEKDVQRLTGYMTTLFKDEEKSFREWGDIVL